MIEETNYKKIIDLKLLVMCNAILKKYIVSVWVFQALINLAIIK